MYPEFARANFFSTSFKKYAKYFENIEILRPVSTEILSFLVMKKY